MDSTASGLSALALVGTIVAGITQGQTIGLTLAAVFLLGSLIFGVLVLRRLGQVADTSERILQRADDVLEKQQRLEDSLKRG